MRHVAHRVDVNQEADARDYQHHHRRERVEMKADVDAEVSQRAVGQAEGSRRQPGVENLLKDVTRLPQQGEEASHGPEERYAGKANGNHRHLVIRQALSHEELDHRAQHRKQRNQPDLFEKEIHKLMTFTGFVRTFPASTISTGQSRQRSRSRGFGTGRSGYQGPRLPPPQRR